MSPTLDCPVLSFESVTVEADDFYDSAIWDVSFALYGGDLALIRLENAHVRLPLADTASGLVNCSHGRVQFLGHDWHALPAREADALRGRIGRTFADGGWVHQLDVDENVILARLHHSDDPVDTIENQAAELARLFGLPGLGRGRAARSRRSDLSRAACVRALLGRPELLLLETPADGADADLLPVLANEVAAARHRGAAVLWTTVETETWSDRGLNPTLRGVMSGSQLSFSERET